MSMDFDYLEQGACLPQDGSRDSLSTPAEQDPPSGSVNLGDVPSQRRAAWGKDVASSIAVPTATVVTAPQDNADYWLLAYEAPLVQAAGEVASIADPNNDPRAILLPLSEVLTRYAGEHRSVTFGVRGGAGLDEGLTIANLFNELLLAGAPAKVIIRARNPSDPIYINRVVTLYASNCEVEFRSPVIYGEAGALRMFGEQPEVLRNDKTAKAKLRSQATSGHSVLHLSSSDAEAMQALDFIAGDVIVLRGQNDAFGKALTKQVVHVLSVDTVNNDLYLFEELEFSFEVTYPSSDWPADLTTGTTIALADYAALTVNGSPQAVTVRVNRTQLESGNIAAGSVVQLSTNETEADINFNAHSTSPTTTSASSLLIGTGSKAFVVVSASGFTVGMYIRAAADSSNYMAGVITGIVGTTITVNVSTTVGAGTLASWTLVKPYRNTARLEIKKVLSIAVVDADESDVTFDSPILDTYATAKFAGITLYTPIVNSSFKGVRATYSTDQASKNTHGVQIGYGRQCQIKDCFIDGSGGQKGNAFRISNSVDCYGFRCRVENPKHFASSEGYGCTVYVSNNCRFLDSDAEGCRHGFLIQKSNLTLIQGCRSVNDLISGFDVHGVRSINTHFIGCWGIGGPGLAADATHKSIFRVGNTSHAAGDINTFITGCFVNGAVLSGTIDTYAALEVFGASSGIFFTNNFITDVDTDVRLGFDNSANDNITNFVEKNNIWQNVTFKYDDQTGPTIDDQSDGIREAAGVATADLALSPSMPIDGSAPVVSEGVQVLTTSYTSRSPKRRIRLAFVCPFIQIPTGGSNATGAVAGAIFVDGVFLKGTVVRVTLGATSGEGLTINATFVATGAAQTITVRLGVAGAVGAIINPSANNWGGNCSPYLILQEMS